MELSALLQQQALVGDFLGQTFAEAVLVFMGRGLAVQDAALLERLELALDGDAFAADEGLQLGPGELASEHGGDLYDTLGGGAQPVEPRSQDLVDGRRYADLRERARQSHLVLAAEQDAFLEQRPGKLFEVERIALGALDDRALEFDGQRPARDGARDLRRLVRAEAPQRQPGEGRLRPPLRLKVRSMGREDHHAVSPHTRDRDLDHLARRVVHPVEVLDHQHRRRPPGRGRRQPADGLDRALLDLVGGSVVQALAGDAEQLPEERHPGSERRLDGADLGNDLLERRCGRFARKDLEELPEHSRHRRVGERLAQRGAASLEEEVLFPLEPLAELVDEARLAAAGIADDRDHLRQPLRHAAEARDELGHLGVASDEPCQPARLGDRHRSADSARANHLEGGDRLALAFDLERSAVPSLEEAPYQSLRRLAHEHRSRLRQRLQAGGEIGGVADRGIVGLEIAADRADDDRSGVSTDPNEEIEVATAPGAIRKPCDGVANGECRRDRALRGVLVSDGRAEQRHEAVARQLVDDALDPVDLAEGELEVLVEKIVVLLGVEPLGDRGRPHQVAEENGHELPLSGGAASGVANLASELGGDVPRQTVVGRRGRRRGGRGLRGEGLSAIRAEAKLRTDLGAAASAPSRDGSPASGAEALALDQFAVAARAAHAKRFGRGVERVKKVEIGRRTGVVASRRRNERGRLESSLKTHFNRLPRVIRGRADSRYPTTKKRRRSAMRHTTPPRFHLLKKSLMRWAVGLFATLVALNAEAAGKPNIILILSKA